MQVDLGFVNSICYLKTLRVTLKIEVKKKKGEVFGFLFLTSLQNDACQWSFSSTSSCGLQQTRLFQIYLLLENKEAWLLEIKAVSSLGQVGLMPPSEDGG